VPAPASTVLNVRAAAILGTEILIMTVISEVEPIAVRVAAGGSDTHRPMALDRAAASSDSRPLALPARSRTGTRALRQAQGTNAHRCGLKLV